VTASSNGTQKDKEQDKKWTDAAAEFKAVNSWESEGKKFTQYELTVTNHGSSAIDESLQQELKLTQLPQ